MKRAAFAFLFGATCFACSGDDMVDPPPDTPGITLEALCDELAAADCERIAACDLLGGPIDATSCVTRQRATLCTPTITALSLAIDAQAVTYFELAARDCRRAVSERECAWGFDYDLFEVTECRGMFDTQTAAGDTCHLSAACGDGLWCDPGTECPGTCRAFLGNNDMCSFGDRCAAGLFCSATSQRCLAQVNLGAECAIALSGNSCLNGGFCDGSQPGPAVCRPVRGRGEGCQSANECIVGASCIRNRCAAGEVGDVCDEPFHCQSGTFCSGGTCVAPVAEGATCLLGGAPCRAGFTCGGEAGMEVCTSLVAPTGACLSDAECFLGRCENDLCVEALVDGAGCTGARECLPGRTCEEKCVVTPRTCER